MSSARSVFRSTAVLGIARIIERTSGLVLALLISRHLGPAALGVYATAVAYFGLIAVAGESGSTNLLIRELSKDRERTASYVVHTSIMAFSFSAFVTALALVVIPHLGYHADLRHSLELIVLAVLPGTLNTIQEAVFVAHQRVEFETMTTFVSSALQVAISLFLIERGRGVVSVVLAFVVLEYAVTFVYYVLISRYIARLHFEFHRSVAREILREMKTFAGSSIVAGIFARPEIVILSLLATEAQVGYYSGAVKIVDLFQFVPQVFMTNVFPLLSRSFHLRDGGAQQLQDRALAYLLALGIPVAAGLAAAAPAITDRFYGDRFHPATPLLRILAISVIMYCTNAVLWRVLAARGEQAAVLRNQIATAATRLGGGAALVAAFGAVGAAVAASFSLVMQGVLLGRSVCRRPGSRVSIVRIGWRFALPAAAMGLLVFAISDELPLWAVVPVATLVYAGLVALLRGFSQVDLVDLRGVAPALRFRRAS